MPYAVHGSFRKHLGVIQSVITTLDETDRAVAIAPHDRTIDLSSERTQPQPGLLSHWVSQGEAQVLAQAGQVEPNAAMLLQEYAAKVAS